LSPMRPGIIQKAGGVTVGFLSFCILWMGPSALASSQEIVLTAEFPVDLAAPPSVSEFSGVLDPAYIARVPDGEAALAVLAEARWVFSGMVWGFDYVYTPSDKARAIDELFEIRSRSPQAGLVMDLRPVSARLEDTTLIALVAYRPNAVERREMAAWGASSAAVQGMGSARAFRNGAEGAVAEAQAAARRDAMTDAVQEALRAYLRGVTHNKPREVRGSFALTSAPRLFLRAGSWIATVKLYARVEEIVSYGAY